MTERLLGEASVLIEEALAGLRTEDFRNEFLSYWNRAAKGSPRLLSLLATFDSTHLVSLWRGKQYYLVGESANQLKTWLARRYSDDQKDFRAEQAVLISLPSPLIPQEYPKNSADLLAIIRERSVADIQILSPFLTGDLRNFFVILSAPSANGPALAAVRIFSPSATNILGRRMDVINHGFRNGKVPATLMMTRYFNSATATERFAVDRADSAWVHGRGRDKRAHVLHKRKIAILGVGSIGGFVAEHLACAGVGKIVLVDPELLSAANAGRHILGINNLDVPKASGVAQLLQPRFPHHEITGVRAKAQDFVGEHKTELADFDLVLCLTGDWSAESFINEWSLKSEERCPRILFGWLEPHALAGHAVLISSKSACLGCHFTETGKCDLSVTHWDNSNLVQEPACGGMFQPYGPVELANINAMISSVALDGLLNEPQDSLHRVYASGASSIENLGGQITSEWQLISAAFHPAVSSTTTLKWTKNLQCRWCGGT